MVLLLDEITTTIEASQVARMQSQYQLNLTNNIHRNNYSHQRRLALNRESRKRRMEDPEYHQIKTARRTAARQRNNAQLQAYQQGRLDAEPGNR
jgi:hypothetical protein